MIRGLDTPPNPAAARLIHPATANPAVALCCKAYARAYKEAAAAGKDRILAKFAAGAAYRNAMPPLEGPENIRGFIACAAHAMLIGALETSDGAKLLYAAQVASGLLPRLAPPTAASDRSPAAKPDTALPRTASSASDQPPDRPSPAPLPGRQAVAYPPTPGVSIPLSFAENEKANPDPQAIDVWDGCAKPSSSL